MKFAALEIALCDPEGLRRNEPLAYGDAGGSVLLVAARGSLTDEMKRAADRSPRLVIMVRHE